ncbi:MAG: molybdopterin cofactor-binding domain-containing protein [Bacteroidota bacterium]
MAKKEKKTFNRRKFLVRSGIGIGVLVGTTIAAKAPFRRFLAKTVDEVEMTYNNKAPVYAWFQITPENKLILHSPKVEMGQGAFTGMAQLVAEELNVRIEAIEVVHASSLTGVLDPMSTGGSTTIAGFWQPLRELAATMREMIKTEAATIQGVDVSTLSVEDGIIKGGSKDMTYGEVVAQVQEWKVPKKAPELKSASTFKYIGKPIPRVDLLPKVKGDPIFGLDASMPNMLYGAVVRPHQVDAVFESADTSEAENMPGVIKVVLEPDFVGVVAKTKTQAENAKKAIKVAWTVNKVWQQAEIEANIKVGQGKPVIIQKSGNVNPHFEGEGLIMREYTSPIGAHAQIEPNGAVAFVEADKATIMMGTQVVKITRDEVAQRLGMKADQVEVISSYLGGGFGRRLHTPNAIQAALLSKAVGKPVHCFFDRKEEFQNDTFRPPTHHVMKAKLNEKGGIEAIEHNVSSGDVAFGSALMPRIIEPVAGADFGAWRGGMFQYENIPNFKAISWRVKLPFATSWWRSLGLLANTFAIESFMDELAITAEKDPVQFRLEHTTDDDRGRRLKGVIEAAAEKAGWGKKQLPEGHAMGFAASTDANTPVAQVVEVSVEGKKIKVHKVVSAIDPGIAINPDGIRAQSEGAIIMGLSATLFEKMEIKDGSIVPTNYGLYQIALMKDAPKDIEVIILESGEKPTGVGEPPLGPIGAAIANAVFRITGQRLTDLPLTLA